MLPITFCTLYAGGYVAQFIRNYQTWESAGNFAGNGTAPQIPSPHPLACLDALTAFPAVFLVYPYHADTGNRQKGNTRDQVLCPECTDPQQHTPESGGECTGDTAGSCRQHTEQQSGENKLQFELLHRNIPPKKKKADNICVKSRCHQQSSGFGIPRENIIPESIFYYHYTSDHKTCQVRDCPWHTQTFPESEDINS
jgi:hypothetical protein